MIAASVGATPPAAMPPAATRPDDGRDPLDVTADAMPDSAATVAQAYAKRAALVMLAMQSEQQTLQARLDRLKADFNASQEERSEMLREMNALRDMAVEQAKKDDEILKKFIAMI
jgi:hypothetical protein